MPDDVTLNSMSGGAVVATDEIATGEHVQIVKLAYSADGDRTPIEADSSGIKANLSNVVASGGAYSLGDNGFPMLTVDSSGNWAPPALDVTGNLRVSVENPLPAGANVIGAVTQSGGAWNVYGTVAIAGVVPVSQYATPWSVVERGATIAHGSASVTTSAGQVLASSITRRSVTLTNLGSADVWIGASGISANNGVRLSAGQSLVLDSSPNAAIHAISSSGTQTVAYLIESD